MSDTVWTDFAFAAGLAFGLYLGANADVTSLSASAAVIGGCAMFGFLVIGGAVGHVVYRAIRRNR